MTIPHGVKEAALIAAQDVLMEWLPAVIEDPAAVLAGTALGSTFQEYLTPRILSEAEARRRLTDLGVWDPGADDGSHAGAVDRYARARQAAAIDIARALIALATGHEVPTRAAALADALAPLVAVVKDAIARGEPGDLDLEALLDA